MIFIAMNLKEIYANVIRKAKAFNPCTSMAVKIGIILAVVVLVTLMFPKGESIEFDYRIGSIWGGDEIIAPFSFPIYKDDRQYEREKVEAERDVIPVFNRDDAEGERALDSVRVLFEQLRLAAAFDIEYRRKRTELQRGETALRSQVEQDSVVLFDFKSQMPVQFNAEEWQAVVRFHQGQVPEGYGVRSFDDLQRQIDRSLREYYRTGILDKSKRELVHGEVAVRRNADEVLTPVDRFLDLSQANLLYEQALASLIPSPGPARNVALKIGSLYIRGNIKYNAGETRSLVRIAREEVPRTIGFVLENERIVSRHERITEDTRLRLDSFRRAKAERGGKINIILQYIGKGLHVSIVILLFGIYFYLFRKNVFHDNAKLALIAIVILMMTFFAYLTLTINVDAPVEYLIFVPAAAMLLTIMFDSRLAFYGTVIIAVLVGGIRGNDYTIMLVSLIGGALAAYTVRDIKHRTQIFRSMVFIFLGYTLTILALSLERFETPMAMVQEITFAAVNAVFSPVLTFGLLIFFERTWKITTDLTLLELSDFNHPLLRDLSQKAPGTFHHSLVMGSLAETAAEAIGANTTLARVGAYYHDIGKMLKPEYFIENQMGFKNRHDKLTPRMSSLILIAHVKDGMELARKYKLPKEILEFIPMHHGKTLISYFYKKALEKKTDKDEVNEQDYRYPGPKPQTKETGIVMLADAVEAAARSIEEPSIAKLKATIDGIIKSRFEEGELDECELTFKDLTKIREAFFKVLVGIHHPRIKYPGQEEKEEEALKHSKEKFQPLNKGYDVAPVMPPEESNPVPDTKSDS
jgi:cyclic-di-AMP phosphodiesterase PgpH